MYKFLAISLLSFFIASISHASIVGKGLFCANEKGNNPFFGYFKDSKTFELFGISGYEITVKERLYTLDGTKTIRVDISRSNYIYYYINRQTLKIRREMNFSPFATCVVANSRMELIRQIQSIINKAKNKNKI